MQALNGRVLDSLSPEDTPIFHINEGVAMQPSLPAADWGETGKQAESCGRDDVQGWVLLHMLDFDWNSHFIVSSLFDLDVWKIEFPAIVPIIVICELGDKSKLLLQ